MITFEKFAKVYQRFLEKFDISPSSSLQFMSYLCLAVGAAGMIYLQIGKHDEGYLKQEIMKLTYDVKTKQTTIHELEARIALDEQKLRNGQKQLVVIDLQQVGNDVTATLLARTWKPASASIASSVCIERLKRALLAEGAAYR